MSSLHREEVLRTMDIIDEILTRHEFIEDPPVLIDIGCSGQIFEKWRNIAKYSICVGFDADDREMQYVVKANKAYKKLFIENCIATNTSNNTQDFYLTKSPFCSSTLKPDLHSLRQYLFYDLFAVRKKVKLNASNINSIIRRLGLRRVDWFKTDSQGTDLRLFDALDASVKNNILVADFEPGIVDAYQDEDKLADLLSYMDALPFWVSAMHVCGNYRLNTHVISKKLNYRQIDLLTKCSKTAPTCAEITYTNSFFEHASFSKRDFLLMWIFAIINEQLGFALEVSTVGKKRFRDSVFDNLEKHIMAVINKKRIEIKQQEALQGMRKRYRFLILLYEKIKEKIRNLIVS